MAAGPWTPSSNFFAKQPGALNPVLPPVQLGQNLDGRKDKKVTLDFWSKSESFDKLGNDSDVYYLELEVIVPNHPSPPCSLTPGHPLHGSQTLCLLFHLLCLAAWPLEALATSFASEP